MIAIPIPSESYAATLLVQRTNNNLIYTDSEIIEYGPLPFFLAGWMTCEIGNSVYYILLLACVILTALYDDPSRLNNLLADHPAKREAFLSCSYGWKLLDVCIEFLPIVNWEYAHILIVSASKASPGTEQPLNRPLQEMESPGKPAIRLVLSSLEVRKERRLAWSPLNVVQNAISQC